MVALVEKSVWPKTNESVHDRFLAMLPQIRRQALAAFRSQRSEAREELDSEVVANAFSRLGPAGAPRQRVGGVPHAVGTICDRPSS